MATPLSLQDSDEMVSSGMGSQESISGTASLRKRNRHVFEDSSEESGWDFPDDGRPKTRRVNPQRLAIRLGPSLVAEMEALIVPGVKMPTFAVRKDFQERYQVDRRHIYDYFHSRGLRVAKEDKHTNLVRGRALKAQAQMLAARQAETSTPSGEQDLSPCDIPKVTPSSNASRAAVKPRSRTVRKQGKAQERKRRATRGPAVPSSGGVPALDPSLAGLSVFSVGASDPQAGTMSSSSSTDTDWDSVAACPDFSMPCDTSDDTVDKAGTVSDFLPSPDDFIAGYFDSPTQLQQPFLDLEANAVDLDSFTVMDEHRFLTADERSEFYNLINNNISGNLDEPVETYSNFPSERARSRFDRPNAMPRNSRTPKVMSNVTRTSNTVSPMSGDSPDLRKWLSDEVNAGQLAFSDHDYNLTGDTFDVSLLNGCAANSGMYFFEVQNHSVFGDLTSRYAHY